VLRQVTKSVEALVRKLETFIVHMLAVAQEPLSEDCDKWVGIADSALLTWRADEFMDVDGTFAAVGAEGTRQKAAFLVRAISWASSRNTMVLEFGKALGKQGAASLPEELLKAVADFQVTHRTRWNHGGANTPAAWPCPHGTEVIARPPTW
jgi:hypothetical protein